MLLEQLPGWKRLIWAWREAVLILTPKRKRLKNAQYREELVLTLSFIKTQIGPQMIPDGKCLRQVVSLTTRNCVDFMEGLGIGCIFVMYLK